LEDAKLREEKIRKINEHRQKIIALEEEEYRIEDDKRAKAADEMMWLEFETRMRGLIRRVVEPALKLSMEDRENSLELELRIE
jgi:hypothetical protein